MPAPSSTGQLLWLRFWEVDGGTSDMYIVHVKYVTASEARKNWFRLLDEAANGEIIAIRRHDKKLVLRIEDDDRPVPSYEELIRVPNADEADNWRWEWSPSEGAKPVEA